jgi:hypothetical protein
MRVVYRNEGYVPPVGRGGPFCIRDSDARREDVLVVTATRGEPLGEGEGRRNRTGLSPLESRDREVRRHERAHLAALGPYAASGAIFDIAVTEDGPAALGGKVKVDLSEVPGDPEATLRKARTIMRAAYAPSEASTVDAAVAAEAGRLAAKAREDVAARYRGNADASGSGFEAFA